MTDGVDRSFADVWADYTEDHLGKRTELSIPEDFDRSEWREVGYLPPKRRSDNEVYSWSQFYDFFQWLQERGYLTMPDQTKEQT